jgi:sulfhydrogenase subunit alpha
MVEQGMSKRLVVDTGPLARVEGEGSLTIEAAGNEVLDVKLNIFEPPRYFESLLRGRKVEDVVDIVSRICGICPVAYQVSALNALEGLFSIEVDEQVQRLRRILYYGEWIESHALHIFMLAAPDFLNVPDVIAIAKNSAELVKKALTVKKLGNRMMTVVGGREVHPVATRIGGVYKAPTKESLQAVAVELKGSLAFAKEAVKVVASFEKPRLQRNDVTLVALKDSARYAIDRGEIISNGGARLPPSSFEQYFEPHQVNYSNSLRWSLKGGGPYMVGPLARFNLNYSQLHPTALECAESVGFKPPVTDPFLSVVARAVELVHAIEEVSKEVDDYVRPPRSYVDYKYVEGTGFGVSEAPRGVLYHRYGVDSQGYVTNARIAPPTAQNLMRVEEDVRQLAPVILSKEPGEARRISEIAVRNYDPCISCATHFLKLRINRA